MFLRVYSSVWGQLTNGSAFLLCPENWDLLIFLSPYSRCFLLPALLLWLWKKQLGARERQIPEVSDFNSSRKASDWETVRVHMGTQPGQSSLKGAIGLKPHLYEDPMQLTGQGLNKWLSQTQAPHGPLPTGSAYYKPAQGMYSSSWQKESE